MDVHELGGDAPLGQRVGEEVVGAAVEGLGGDEVVPGPGEVQHGERLRRLPARHRQRRHATLELGDPLLEDIDGGFMIRV